MAKRRDPDFDSIFDRARLHALLDRQRLAYTTTSNGSCFVEFTSSTSVPFIVNLSVTSGPCFSVRSFLACFYSAAKVPVLLATINRWHSEHRWPRAHVVFDEAPVVFDEAPVVFDEAPAADPHSVAVYADAHFPLAAGVSDDQLDDWFWTAVDAADGLLTLIYELTALDESEFHTPTARELNGWLKRS